MIKSPSPRLKGGLDARLWYRQSRPWPSMLMKNLEFFSHKTTLVFKGNGALPNMEDLEMAQRSQSQPVESIELQPEALLQVPKFIIALDFGTTFSSVAFVRVEPGTSTQLIGSESIKCIDNYPDMPPVASATVLASNPTVPTELLCYTKQKNLSYQDSFPSETSDHDSVNSLDDEWASSGPEDSGQENGTLPHQLPGSAVKHSLWGYGVHSRLGRPDIIPQDLKHLKNFKLQLDESEVTRTLRRESTMDMKALGGVKTVDVIADYLTQLFTHTKARLTACHGLRDESPVELVLCVPNAWTDKACRVMQDALTIAIKNSRLARLESGTIKDLFIVAEPEAAAASALEDRECVTKIRSLQSFLLLDCGGGTVDAITYTLTDTDPPRMREVVPPEGATCGSSFLNREFHKLLSSRLQHARIVGNDTPLPRIIDSCVQEFENVKRGIDILDKSAGFAPVYVQGLQADEQKNFRKNKVDLTWREISEVFKPCIRGVAGVMQRQLRGAKDQGINVETVILIGGFGDSPSLQGHLRKVLRNERNATDQLIDLVRPNFTESAVARGAVLRALRKDNGPARISRSSYGILRNDMYDPGDPLHSRFRVTRDPADGELYVKNTIRWVLDKDKVVPTRYEDSYRSRHVFKIHEPRFLCEEVLYVSSSKHLSGYKVGHKVNKGAERAGSIVSDMTFLRSRNLLPPKTEQNAEGKSFSYYEVLYDLFLIIEGRTLRFEARSPADSQEVTGSAKFCIAAGFAPGTA